MNTHTLRTRDLIATGSNEPTYDEQSTPRTITHAVKHTRGAPEHTLVGPTVLEFHQHSTQVLAEKWPSVATRPVSREQRDKNNTLGIHFIHRSTHCSDEDAHFTRATINQSTMHDQMYQCDSFNGARNTSLLPCNMRRQMQTCACKMAEADCGKSMSAICSTCGGGSSDHTHQDRQHREKRDARELDVIEKQTWYEIYTRPYPW